MDTLFTFFFILLIVAWLAIFLFCYSYYSQVNKNRINFKIWSVLSFLFMLAISQNIIFYIFKQEFFGRTSLIVHCLIYLRLTCCYLDDLDSRANLSTKNNKILRKIYRYCNIFLQILTFIVSGLTIAYVDFIGVVINSLIIVIISFILKNRLIMCIYITYILYAFSTFLFEWNIICTFLLYVSMLILSCLIIFTNYKKDKKFVKNKNSI